MNRGWYWVAGIAGLLVFGLLVMAVKVLYARSRLYAFFASGRRQLTLVKWLPLGRGHFGRGTTVFFVNYADEEGRTFRAIADAGLWSEVFIHDPEEIAELDDPETFDRKMRDKWFYDPSEIYDPDE